MTFKTWLSDLTKIQGVINNIGKIDLFVNDSNLLNANTVKALSSSINGLSIQQAQLALSTKKLTNEQMNQVLIESGLIASENKIQAELLQTTLAQTALSKEKQNAILIDLGLMKADTLELFSTKSCTKAKLEDILATKGITGANAEAIISTLGLSTANTTATFSFELLAASIWQSITALWTFLTTTPLGWFTMIAGGIGIVVGGISLLTTSMEEASEATTDAISELSSITSEIETLEGKIADLKSQIDGLNPITDEEDIRRLEAETLELENQLAILKEKERLAKEDTDEKARESLGKTQTSRYEVIEGQSQVVNGYIQETGGAYAEVTREEELKNAMKAYDEYYKQRLALEAELAKMSADDEGYKDKENQIKLLNQQMTDARTHASELALALDEEKAGLSGTTAESKALLDSTNATLSTYSQWLNGINGTTDALNKNANAIDNATASATKFTKTEMIDTINSMADGFDVLDDIYADVLDGGTFDFTKLDTSKFSEAFSEITPEYEKFIETVSASPTDIDACQGAFNDLVSAFIESKGILSGLTEENKDLTISMLQNMGVANAEDIVMAQLAMQTEALALQEQFATEKGYELAEATYAEALEFINEAECSAVAKQELAELALEKIHVNEQTIDTSADIENVIALANAANASALAISKLKSAQTVMSSYESGGLKSGAISMMDVREAQKVIDSIENGSFNYDYQPLKASDYLVTSNSKYTPKYSGADQTASAIEKANKSASDSAKDASEEAKKAYSDWFDFMDIRVEKLDDAFTNLEKGMENVVGAFAKNQLVDAQLGIVDEEINNYTDALAMYKQQAQNVLSTIEDADLRDKIVNGAVELSQIQGENADVVKSAMEAYQNWSGKIQDCQIKLAELQKELENLELAKFTNIVDDFNDMFDLREDGKDLIEKQIDLIRESGNFVGKSYYQTLIEQSGKQLVLLEEEKAKLVSQMNSALNSGRVKVGSEAWVSMLDHIQEVEESILDVKTNIEELDTELLNLHFEVFEKVQENFDNIGSELENLAGLFDDELEIKVSDGNGNWTDEALGQLGLLAQNLELSKYRVTEYGKEIEKLNQDYLNGKYTLLEYQEKLAELSQGQWDAVNSAESLEDAIIDLNETRIDEEIETIEDEIDAYEKLIDTQLELIDETEELRKKREDLAEKSKSVTDIEKQLASMQNDDSQATIAKRKLLEEELANAKKDLENAEHEYSVESQKSALEQQLEDFQNARNAEIEALRLSLENRELLISQSFENVKANASLVGEQIALIAQEHGVTVSDAIITSWANGETAIASYGETLSAQSSAFIGNIMGVESEVYNLQMQADNSSIALANMFATRADNLVGQLQASYMAEGNLNYATGVLQNSLVNTLERGYNIGGITSALSGIESGLNSVASAAQSAYDNIQKTLGAQASVPKYKLVDTRTDEVLATGSSWSDVNKVAQNKYLGVPNLSIQAFAKGGIVKKDENILTPIAKALGEDTMVAVKYDEVVLNKKQTSMLQNLASVAPDIEQMWNIPNYSVQIPVMQRNERPNVTINYDSMLHVDNFTDAPHLIGAIESTSKKVTTKILNDINRDFRIHSR